MSSILSRHSTPSPVLGGAQTTWFAISYCEWCVVNDRLCRPEGTFRGTLSHMVPVATARCPSRRRNGASRHAHRASVPWLGAEAMRIAISASSIQQIQCPSRRCQPPPLEWPKRPRGWAAGGSASWRGGQGPGRAGPQGGQRAWHWTHCLRKSMPCCGNRRANKSLGGSPFVAVKVV